MRACVCANVRACVSVDVFVRRGVAFSVCGMCAYVCVCDVCCVVCVPQSVHSCLCGDVYLYVCKRS